MHCGLVQLVSAETGLEIQEIVVGQYGGLAWLEQAKNNVLVVSAKFLRARNYFFSVTANVHTLGTLLWSSGDGDLDLNGVIDCADMSLLLLKVK